MSDSGKRVTTVIACTTMETVRVSEPAVFYEADRLHIIYMAEKGSEKEEYYSSVVDVIENAVSKNRSVEVFRHNETVYRYNVMLHVVNEIIRKEKEEFGDFVDIYINISSGTPEYAAAAICASMMNQGTIPFTVGVKEHTIPFDKYREMTSVDGMPVGDAKAVYNPKMVETFKIEPPDEELVKYLQFFDSLEGRPYTPRRIIALLEENGIWRFVSDKKNPSKSAPTMAYNRNVRDPLIQNGWLKNGPSRNRWIVTPAGRAILDMFTDEDNRITIRDLIEDYSINCCMMREAFFDEDRDC